jgi:hypothetical protein
VHVQQPPSRLSGVSHVSRHTARAELCAGGAEGVPAGSTGGSIADRPPCGRPPDGSPYSSSPATTHLLMRMLRKLCVALHTAWLCLPAAWALSRCGGWGRRGGGRRWRAWPWRARLSSRLSLHGGGGRGARCPALGDGTGYIDGSVSHAGAMGAGIFFGVQPASSAWSTTAHVGIPLCVSDVAVWRGRGGA